MFRFMSTLSGTYSCLWLIHCLFFSVKVVNLKVKVAPRLSQGIYCELLNKERLQLKGKLTLHRCMQQETISNHRVRCKYQPVIWFFQLVHLTPYLQQPVLINCIKFWWTGIQWTLQKSNLSQIKRPPDRWKSIKTQVSRAKFGEHRVVCFFLVFVVGILMLIPFILNQRTF